MAEVKQLKAELEKLKSENEKLKNQNNKPLTFKVSTKGAISVYNLQRFPVTLYKDQWTQLFERIDDLKEFIIENDTNLKNKI